MALLGAAVLAAGCSSGRAGSGSSSGAPVTIKAVLPPNTGPITAADNVGLQQLTQQYEAAHKNVTVQWLPNNTTGITQANASMESQASGGSAPDVVWEQYGPVTSGALPDGLLQNIKPYLDKPNPYVPGNTSWLSLFSSSTVPYMTSPNGDIDIILGSNVETGMFYSKAAFAKAGITATPHDVGGLHDRSRQAEGRGHHAVPVHHRRPCNPSWFERLATSSLLAGQVSQFDVNHAQVTNGLDVAVGIHKGIIGMSNPQLRRGVEAARPARAATPPAGRAPTTRAPTRTPPRRR